MIRIAVLLLISLLCSTVYSQNEDSPEADSVNVSGYISPYYLSSDMLNHASFIGCNGALFLSHHIFIGGTASQMLSNYHTHQGIYSGNELDISQWGGIAGVVVFPEHSFRPVFSISFGSGSLSLSDVNKTRIKKAFDNFFWYKAQVEAEYKINKYCSAGAGICYSLVSGLVLDGYSEPDFEGPGIFINIKAGILN